MKVDKIEVYPLYVPLSESIPAPVSLPHAEKIEKFALAEDLPFHARSVRQRFDDLKARARGR